MSSYVSLFRNRYASDKSSSDADRTESTPSPEFDAIELAPVIKRTELVELQEITSVKATLSSGSPKDQERVFQDLTLLPSSSLRSQPDSNHGVQSARTNAPEQLEVSEETELGDPEITQSDASSTDSDEGFDYVEHPLPSFTQILYTKDHVAMFPQKNTKLSGRLSVVKQHGVLFITWSPHSTSASERAYSIPPIPLSEIRAITRHTPTLGWHYIILVLMSGCTFPPLYFNNGGVRSLLSTLKQHSSLVKAVNDPNTYLTNESPDPLRRSLHSMDLDDLILGGLGVENDTFDHKLLSGTITKLKHIALGKSSHRFNSEAKSEPHFEDDPKEESTSSSSIKIPTRDLSVLGEGVSLMTEVGSFELLDILGSRPTDRFDHLKNQENWGKAIPLAELRSFFDQEGHMIREEKFRERVFFGGLSSETQREGWKYLFGLWKVDWTRSQCESTSREKQAQYEALRSQWETITPDQEKRFAKWRDRRTKIEKDVRRTDRSEHFFRHEHGEPLKALTRILHSYVMYNFDLSYCQGMSDLAAPILYVLTKGIHPREAEKWNRAEAEAFWCFSGMMDRVEANFHTDQRGMHAQLLALEKLLQLLDPQLYAHFKQKDCLNFFFCFRWMLILFKREFSFHEVLRLWEAIFSGHSSQYFHLYFCIAILVTHRNTILQEDMDFDELLKYTCGLSGKINLNATLKLATVLSAWTEPIEADCFEDIFI